MPPCPANAFSYTVQPGDSLWLISQRFHTTVQEILSINTIRNQNQLFIGQVLCIPQAGSQGRMPVQPFSQCVSKKEQLLGNQLRMLWEQHVFWTGNAILGMLFHLPNAQADLNRLLRNPADFGELFRQFYGERIASTFAELLTGHLTIAGEFVNAVKAGNQAAADDAERRWFANADQIAAFLDGLNPYWTAQDWRTMFHEHLELLKLFVQEIMGQNYDAAVDTFDKIEREAIMMADAMTKGFVNQFPQYFAC